MTSSEPTNDGAVAISNAETEAVRIMRSGRLFSRIWLGIHAGLSLALRPSDTRQVFRLVIATDMPHLLRLHKRMTESEEGRALLRERPAIDSRHVDYAALRALPADTLGGAYARMINAAQLDPDMFQPPAMLSGEAAFVSQRARQTHDLLHVLTGLSTGIDGEIMLQAFTHGQLRNRTSLLIARGGTLIYGFRFPRLWKDSLRWYRLGRSVQFLLPVRWESLWSEPLTSVRARFGLPEHGGLPAAA